MYGKGENISDPNINEKKIKNLLSGKTFADENFPVASFIIKKDIQKYIRTFYFFARMADDIADHHKLSSSEKVKILLYFDNALKLKIKTDIKVLNNMVEMMESYEQGDFWQVDQNFLRDHIYPLVYSNCMVHDEFFVAEANTRTITYFFVRYTESCKKTIVIP